MARLAYANLLATNFHSLLCLLSKINDQLIDWRIDSKVCSHTDIKQSKEENNLTGLKKI